MRITSLGLNRRLLSGLSVLDQTKVYLSFSSELSTEVKSIKHYLQSAGYDVSTDQTDAIGAVDDSRLIVCILSDS